MKKLITTLIALSVIFYSATGSYAAVPAVDVSDSNPNKYTVSSENIFWISNKRSIYRDIGKLCSARRKIERHENFLPKRRGDRGK